MCAAICVLAAFLTLLSTFSRARVSTCTKVFSVLKTILTWHQQWQHERPHLKPDICARGRYTAAADRPASCSIPAGEWAAEQQEGKLKGFCILSGKCFLWEILLFFGEISWPVKDLTYWQISPVVVKAPVPANTVPCGYIWTVPEHDNVMSQTSWDYCTIDIKDIRI